MASIKKRPDGKYRARFRDQEGKEHARHFARRADAERWLAQQVTKVTEGTWIDPSAGRRTFKDFADLWIAAQIHHRPATASATRSRMKHLIDAFGDRPLASITRTEIQAWVTAKAEDLQPATVEGLYRLLAQVMRAAVEDLAILHSPCRNVKLPRIETELVIPTVEEVARVLEHVPDRHRRFVTTAVGTGMRVSELCGLTVDRVDFLRRSVVVDRQLLGAARGEPRFGPPKTKAGNRVIPVPGEVTDDLAAHLAAFPSTGLVFTSERGTPWTRNRVSDAWRVWCAKADVSFRFHDLRHLYASTLIAAGQSVKVIQQRMGHSSAAVTLDTYGHLMPSDEDGTRSAVGDVLRTVRGLGG